MAFDVVADDVSDCDDINAAVRSHLDLNGGMLRGLRDHFETDDALSVFSRGRRGGRAEK
jgi:hypothetical protein